MRHIDGIVIHCTATPEGRDVTAAEVTRWHKARKFRTIGYHYLIRLDGTIEIGRSHEETGAHVLGYNQHTLGIVYAGGCADEDGLPPKDTRTDAQVQALLDLCMRLHREFPFARVCGHNEIPGVRKACPSFNVSEWFDRNGLLYLWGLPTEG